MTNAWGLALGLVLMVLGGALVVLDVVAVWLS